MLIDAQTYAVTDTRELPGYVSALLLSQPLHFGDYGGMPLKILWALLDLVTIAVLGSGLYLMACARQCRHRRAPRRARSLGWGRLQWGGMSDAPRFAARSPFRVYAVPTLLGASAVVGHSSALLGDDLWDAVSWIALAMPLLPVLKAALE